MNQNCFTAGLWIVAASMFFTPMGTPSFVCMVQLLLFFLLLSGFVWSEVRNGKSSRRKYAWGRIILAVLSSLLVLAFDLLPVL